MGGFQLTGGPSNATITAKTVLSEARGLIADEANWTQGVWARDADGEPVKPGDPAAAAWCAQGAIVEVVLKHDRRGDNDLTLAIAEALAPHVGVEPPYVGTALVRKQDAETTTHAEVLAWLDAASREE
jgi:hypothetical protein